MKTSAYIFAAVLLLAGVQANAQSLAPSVTVTNDFANSINETGKQSVQMSVPDSIRNNVPKFDYSVFANPYNGSYKFSPYNVKINLPGESYDASRFYMKAGAGYAFYPEFKMVVAPFYKGRFKMSVYQDFHGYGSGYHIPAKEGNIFDLFDGKGVMEDIDKGYDYSESAGLEGTLGFKRAAFKFNFGYEGIFAGLETDTYDKSAFHSVFGVVGVKSVESPEKKLNFDANLLYRLGYQEMAPKNLVENQFKVYGWFAPVSFSKARFLLDYEIGYVGCNGALDFADYIINTTPRVAFNLWKFNISTGFKVSYIEDGINLFPDIRFNIKMIKNHLDLYGVIDGGENINLYSDYKNQYHHFSTAYVSSANKFGSTYLERINMRGGLRGSIAERVQFDVRAGYVVYGGAPVDYIRVIDNGTTPATYSYLPGIEFVNYNKFYADALLTWTSKSVDISGNVHYGSTDIAGRANVLDFPALTTDFDVTYNWHRRLFVGVCAQTSSQRDANIAGTVYSMPSYVDLGFHGEYVFRRVWSVWMRMGNILNQNIQREPLFCERGFNATAGITLKLK